MPYNITTEAPTTVVDYVGILELLLRIYKDGLRASPHFVKVSCIAVSRAYVFDQR